MKGSDGTYLMKRCNESNERCLTMFNYVYMYVQRRYDACVNEKRGIKTTSAGMMCKSRV